MYYIKLELDTYPNPASLLNRQSPISCRLTLDWLEFTWAMMHDVLYNVSTIHLPTNTKSLILGVQCSKYQKGFSTFKYTWRRVSHQPLKLMGFFLIALYICSGWFLYIYHTRQLNNLVELKKIVGFDHLYSLADSMPSVLTFKTVFILRTWDTLLFVLEYIQNTIMSALLLCK